jgi:hypothetical protein
MAESGKTKTSRIRRKPMKITLLAYNHTKSRQIQCRSQKTWVATGGTELARRLLGS